LPIGLIASALPNQLPLNDGRAFVLGIQAILTVAGAISWKPTPTRLIRLLVLGGNASYSIYLIHPFLVSACTKAAMHFMGNSAFSLIATGVVTVSLSISAGVLVYILIELPAHDWLLIRLRNGFKPALSQTP
jgi:peptidoglycan/LPS O-acetylase OafA/YrhL